MDKRTARRAKATTVEAHVLTLAAEFSRGVTDTKPEVEMPGFDEALRELMPRLRRITKDNHNAFAHALRTYSEETVHTDHATRVFVVPLRGPPVVARNAMVTDEASNAVALRMVRSGFVHPEATVVLSHTYLSPERVATAGPGAIQSLHEAFAAAALGDMDRETLEARIDASLPTVARRADQDGAVVGFRTIATGMVDPLSDYEETNDGLAYQRPDRSRPDVVAGRPMGFDRFCRETCIDRLSRDVAAARADLGLGDGRGTLCMGFTGRSVVTCLVQDGMVLGPWYLPLDMANRDMVFLKVIGRRLTGTDAVFYRQAKWLPHRKGGEMPSPIRRVA